MALNRLMTLASTYDACAANGDSAFGSYEPIYKKEKGSDKKEKVGERRPLTPPYHSLLTGDIRIEIDPDGKLYRVVPLTKEDQWLYVIPTNNKAETRTSNAIDAPYPLHEKLNNICGKKGKDGSLHIEDSAYTKNLSAWVNSETFKACTPAEQEGILAVYRYICNGSIFTDVMAVATEKDRNKKDYNPAIIFSVVGMTHNHGDAILSNNQDTWHAYIKYAVSLEEQNPDDIGICYVTGQRVRLLDSGQKNILRQGDEAKLFAAQRKAKQKDDFPSTGRFTYLGGAFLTPSDCATVGAQTAEKAAIMLRWLIDHQGWKAIPKANQVVIVWDKTKPVGTIDAKGIWQNDICSVSAEAMASAENAGDMDIDADDASDKSYDPNAGHARMVRKCRNGEYVKNISDIAQQVTVMVLDKLSKSRVSVCEYYEMSADEFIENAKAWHEDAGWTYWWDERGAYMEQPVERAPSVSDILRLCLGEKYWDAKQDSNIAARATKITLLTIRCINNREARLPYTIVREAMNRVIHTEKLKQQSSGTYEKNLRLTCGLIRKYLNQGGTTMSSKLDEEFMDASYLYGRALAYFDKIESDALWVSGIDRQTNAWRLQSSFFERPAEVTDILRRRIKPYVEKLAKAKPVSAKYLRNGLESVLACIDHRDAHLRPDKTYMLLGYAAQKDALRTKKNIQTNEE